MIISELASQEAMIIRLLLSGFPQSCSHAVKDRSSLLFAAIIDVFARVATNLGQQSQAISTCQVFTCNFRKAP